MELLRVKQRQNTFHNFTVDDREVGKMVLDVMNETNFFGVTVSYAAKYEHYVKNSLTSWKLNGFLLLHSLS